MNARLHSHDVVRCSFVPRARFHGDVLPRAGTFDALEAQLRRDGENISEKDGRGIVVSTFVEGDGSTPGTAGKRGRFRQEALIDETWLLGLDFDTRSGDALEIAAPLKAAGLDVIAYSSHSHGRVEMLRDKVRKELATKLDPERLAEEVERRAHAPRFRVLVRLSRSVSPAEYRVLWAWLDRYLGGGSDGACSDPTRLFYTPRRKAPDAELDPWIVRWRGEPLDPDKLPDGSDVAALIEAARAAGAPAPRSVLGPAEQERRRQEVQALPKGARTKAEKKAQRVLEGALGWLLTATEGERRKRLFAAACRVGEWAEVIGDDGVEAWRRALLDVAKNMPDSHDHARQVANGIHRGRGNPVDVRADLEKRTRSLPILDNAPGEAFELEEAREKLRELLSVAVQGRGAWAVAADPGLGKTTTLLDLLPQLWLEGVSVRFAVPTNKLADELLDAARKVAATGDTLSTGEARAFLGDGAHDPLIGIEPKRHAHNCQNFAAVNAGRRAGGVQGAREVCRKCDLHPGNSGSVGTCAFFLETMRARDYRVTFTTHALEVQRTTARAETFVDVAAFKKAQREDPDGRYQPKATWTPDGLCLTVQPADVGVRVPVLEGDGDDVEAQCRAWLAEADGYPGSDDLEALRAKLADTASDEVDLLVIDESPRAADEKRTVRETDLLTWRGASDVVMSDETTTALRSLLTEAKVTGKTFGAAKLAEAAPAGALRVRRDGDGRVFSTVGRRLVSEHAETAATGAIPLALVNAPEADALEVLEAACNRGWTGCYVDKRGTLHMTHPRRIGRDGVRSTLYLDGTATEPTARALLGGDCAFERIRVAMHPETTTVRVDWSAANRELPSLDDDNDRAQRTLAKRRQTLQKLGAVVRRYESPTTAWVLHKAWCDDDDVRALLPEAFAARRVVYFRAPEATGSNKLQSCTRIVLADWFVPTSATNAAAETLEDRAAPAELDADWHAEALHQLEGAEVVQAAYRVRPVQHARELVLLTERELPSHWPTPTVIDPDELVADELGLLPSGKKGAAMLLAREVKKWGAVALESRVRTAPMLASSYIGEKGHGRETALQSAANAWRDDGRAQGWAEAAGVALAYVRTSAGGAPVPVFFDPAHPPSVETVAALLASPPRWLEWQGVRLELEDATGPVLEEVRRLPSRDGATFDALAESLGVSTSTIRRRLQSVGIRSTDELRAYWERARTPDHVDTPDGGVALAGSPAWLHLASDGDTRRWREVTGTPWPAGGRTEGGCKRSGACRLTAAPWPDERSDWAV